MMTWSSDPNLLTADCDAEDRFVYTFIKLLAARSEHAVPSWRAHDLAQVLLDVAGARGRVPADLIDGEVAQLCRSAGLTPALGKSVAALVGGAQDAETGPPHPRLRSVPEVSGLVEPHLAAA